MKLFNKLVLFLFIFQSHFVFPGHSKFVVDVLGWKYEKENFTTNDLRSLLEDYDLHETHKKMLSEKLSELELHAPLIDEIDKLVCKLIVLSGSWIQNRSKNHSKHFKIKSVEELLLENNLKPGTLTRIKELDFEGIDIKKYGIKKFCNKLERCKNSNIVSLKNTSLNRLEEDDWEMLGLTLQGLREMCSLKLNDNNLQDVNKSFFTEFLEFFVLGSVKELKLVCGEPGSEEHEFVEKILFDFHENSISLDYVIPKASKNPLLSRYSF